MIVDLILSENFSQANKIFEGKISDIISEKLSIARIEIAKEMFNDIFEENEDLKEDVNLGRERVLNYRIRHGKFQLRQIRSHTPYGGYAARRHNVGRQSPSEMQKRRLKARNSKYKKLIQRMRIRQRRRISMNRRKALGLA